MISPSRDIDDQKILQSVSMREFEPMTCEADFSQIEGLNRKTEH